MLIIIADFPKASNGGLKEMNLFYHTIFFLPDASLKDL